MNEANSNPQWMAEHWLFELRTGQDRYPQSLKLIHRPHLLWQGPTKVWLGATWFIVIVPVWVSFGHFAEKPRQTDVPTDIKGNCEEPTTTLRESSCVGLYKSKQNMHRYAISLSLFSRYFLDPGVLKGPRKALGITPAGWQ